MNPPIMESYERDLRLQGLIRQVSSPNKILELDAKVLPSHFSSPQSAFGIAARNFVAFTSASHQLPQWRDHFTSNRVSKRSIEDIYK